MARSPDEIAREAWRTEILRLADRLSPDVRAAFDVVWPEGAQGDEECRVLLVALQRALDRKSAPQLVKTRPGSISYVER